MTNYATQQIDRLSESASSQKAKAEGYKPSIKVGFDGQTTQFMGLSWDQLDRIKAILGEQA